MLPPADVLDDHRTEGGGGKVSGDQVTGPVTPVGEPPDVQHAAGRGGPCLHHARLQVAGRAHHAHRVDVGEDAQGGRFVGDAVLEADDGRGHRRGDGQLGQRGRRLLALDRHQHHRAAAPVDLARVPDGGDLHGGRPGRRFDAQAVGLERIEVAAPGDEGHVETGLEQSAADHPTDGAGAVHHVAHLPMVPRRRVPASQRPRPLDRSPDDCTGVIM